MKFPLLAILIWVLVVTAPLVLRTHGRLSQSRLTKAQKQQSATATPAETDRIVKAFTAKETEFRNALAQYSFKRDALVETIGAGGLISGEYHRTSLLALDASGKRIEKILFFPTPTLSGIGISTEDLDDLAGVQLFPLEASKAPLYNFKYSGTERIDELDLHVFEVSPKQLPDPKKVKDRLFLGRVWVDTQGNQIVKLRGKGMPQPKINPSLHSRFTAKK
jgi:hypothetical protein